MIGRLLSPLINGLFWFAALVVISGGLDYQTTVGGHGLRLDATSPDLIVLLLLVSLVAWHRLGRDFSELSCIRYLQGLYDWIVERGPGFVFAAVGSAALIYLGVAIFAHRGFQTTYDLALFAQAYWNSVQGEILVSSVKGDMILWGDHFNPIVLAILPLYRLWPVPESLLLLQSLALAAGALPLYGLARKELAGTGLAPFVTLAYLLYLPVREINGFDFHPIAFTTPLILAAFYYLRMERYGWFLIFSLMVGMTKETGPIAVGLLGAACFFLNRKRWLGGAVVAGSVVWFLVNLFVIIPIFNPSGVATQLDRYGYLGESFGEILRTLVTRPFHVLSENLSSRELFYPFRILAPVAFLPLLTPVGLLTLPYLVINLLEHSGVQVQLIHYQAELTACVFIATVFGARRAARGRSPRFLATILMAGTFLFFGTSDIYRIRQTRPSEDTRRLHDVLARVPAKASVSAQAAIAPHLTQRRWLHIFPEVEEAEWVVVDYGLDPWPVPPHRFGRTVKRLNRSGFAVVFDDGKSRIYRQSPVAAAKRRASLEKRRRNGKKKKGGE